MTLRATISIAALIALAACKADAPAPANGSTPATAAAVTSPASGDWSETFTETPTGIVMGNPAATVRLVEFGSRSCPACAKFAADSSEPLRAYVKSGKVSYEYRDFLIHPQDLGATLLGRCVNKDAYYAVLEQMYANLEGFGANVSKVTPELQQQIAAMPPQQAAGAIADVLGYTDFVVQRGVSRDKAAQCLADPAALEKIDAQMKSATGTYEIRGTPTFLINGKLVEDANDWAGIEKALKAAGA